MSDAENMVYRHLRQKVMDGELPGGTHIVAGEVAVKLGVSRTPVREALGRLHAEGLVSLIPNRGAFVTAWTEKDLHEAFDLRILLESHAAFLAARRIVAEGIDRLRRLADQMDAEVAARGDGPFDTLTVLNARFHQCVLTEAQNGRLTAAVGTIIDQALATRTYAEYSQEELLRSMAHHRELIDAFVARDSTWAKSVAQSHLHAAYQVMLRTSARTEGAILVVRDSTPSWACHRA